MLSTGELVATLLGIGQRLIQGAFGSRRDVNRIRLRGNGAVAQLSAQPLEQQRRLKLVELLKGGLHETAGLAEQAKQQMLGIELVMAEAEQDQLDTGQSFAGLFGETFERNQGQSSRSARPSDPDQP